MVTIFCTTCKRETYAEQLTGVDINRAWKRLRDPRAEQRWNECTQCKTRFEAITRVRHRFQQRALEKEGQLAFAIAEQRRAIYRDAKNSAVPRDVQGAE